MAYVGLSRRERVDYSGKTSGHGEAYVEVCNVSTDSQGRAHVSRHYEWKHVECRNVPYSGYEDVNITIHVDDDAFNNKVEQTAGSVNMVSGTVALFQANQIQQVSTNAIEIANSLKRGFHSVVAAEISQQIGVVEERSKNAYQLLMNLRNHMEKVHQDMERDYNAIKSRYVKQFDGINKQYTDSIKALDASSFAMSKELAASMRSYAKLEVATQALLPEESSRTRNNLEGSQLNESSSEIIGGISTLLKQNNAYNAFIQNKISNVAVESEEYQSLPVLFVEKDALKSDCVDSACFMQIEDFAVRKSIEGAVNAVLHRQEAVVNNDFQDGLKKKIESANLSDRELDIIKNLMDVNGI